MDAPDADPVHLAQSLRYLRRINALLGYTRTTLNYLEQFSRSWRREQTIRIVDFATGGADLPLAILKWADRRGWRVEVTGIDLHAQTARAARDASGDPRLTIVQADALKLPFADSSFDYATTSLFLHHLDTPDAVKVLAQMARVSRRGVIAGDLLRHYRAYAWIKLLTLFANPMVRHDAPVSVAQGYKFEEADAMRREAGLDFAAVYKHFGHRFVIAGEKPAIA